MQKKIICTTIVSENPKKKPTFGYLLIGGDDDKCLAFGPLQGHYIFLNPVKNSIEN